MGALTWVAEGSTDGAFFFFFTAEGLAFAGFCLGVSNRLWLYSFDGGGTFEFTGFLLVLSIFWDVGVENTYICLRLLEWRLLSEQGFVGESVLDCLLVAVRTSSSGDISSPERTDYVSEMESSDSYISNRLCILCWQSVWTLRVVVVWKVCRLC